MRNILFMLVITLCYITYYNAGRLAIDFDFEHTMALTLLYHLVCCEVSLWDACYPVNSFHFAILVCLLYVCMYCTAITCCIHVCHDI